MNISSTVAARSGPGPDLGGVQTYRLSWRAAAVVAAFSGSLLLSSLFGRVPALTYHEIIFAEPAKEMLATGQWLLPRIADIPSTHKPPGVHWTIAATM